MPWIAPAAERSEDYPARRNEPEREMLLDWLGWHPAGAEEDYERYRAECRAVDAALAGAKLGDTFMFREKTTSVRWMLQHLVEEYARHNGHADLLREAIDGSAGM